MNDKSGKEKYKDWFTVESPTEKMLTEEFRFFSKPDLTDEDIIAYYDRPGVVITWQDNDDVGSKWLVGPSKKIVEGKDGRLELHLRVRIAPVDVLEYGRKVAVLIRAELCEGISEGFVQNLIVDGERLQLSGDISDKHEIWDMTLYSFSPRGDEILRRLYAEIDWRKAVSR